jgi:hypothetical protein
MTAGGLIRFGLAAATALGAAALLAAVVLALGVGAWIARRLVHLAAGNGLDDAIREAEAHEQGFRLYEPCAYGGWREIIETEEVAS